MWSGGEEGTKRTGEVARWIGSEERWISREVNQRRGGED